MQFKQLSLISFLFLSIALAFSCKKDETSLNSNQPKTERVIEEADPVEKSPALQEDDFIPSAWSRTDYVVSEDWNGDGKLDTAMVLEREAKDGIRERAVLLVFSDGDSLREELFSTNLILGSNEGGAMGDPFAGLGSEKGILSITHNGGSSWRWTMQHDYMYRNGRMELVKIYDTSYHSASSEGSKELDRDLITQEVIRRSVDEKEKQHEKTEKDESLKPIPMAEFNIRKDLSVSL